MAAAANYELMRDLERRFQQRSGLQSRDHYSIFYGPLRRSPLLMINANPGGTPQNYKIVDVMRGEHEYIEGRNSGPTTRNGAEMLQHLTGSEDPERIRGTQVLNRFFRRSPLRPAGREERAYMDEARPFLEELIQYIQPEAILFGGDAGASLFATAHGGRAIPGLTLRGPNGGSDAVYYREYQLDLPYYRSIPAIGIYHPSKMNSVFRSRVFPLLRKRFASLMTQAN
jgi:uracil-DNA glycosylase